ncbi:MAG: DUF1820 family protein [Chromatiales bacterium]|jgi:hypothetical protein|nr:DUF1820 family protein [Chromatiales bacterium]
MKTKPVYRIAFLNAGKLYEIYAKSISQGQLYGFVEISEIVFGEKSAVVVDPVEEKLKAEFSGVERSFIPLHAIVRIDAVESQGTARISAIDRDTNVTSFPGAFHPQGNPPERPRD